MVIYSSYIFEFFLISIMLNFIEWYPEGVWCNSEMHHFVFGGKLCIFFSEDFLCSYMYNYYNYLEPCLHYMLSFSISHQDLIKFPYFTDLTSVKEGIGSEVRPPKTGWRQSDFKENSNSHTYKDRFTCFFRAWNQSSFLCGPLMTGHRFTKKLLSGRLFCGWVELYFIPSRRI
jgi:hypothetical protein